MRTGPQTRIQRMIALLALVGIVSAPTLAAAQSSTDPDAVACNESRDPDQSIAACSAAISRYPRWFVARVNRGTSYVKKGDTARALLDFDEAIRLNPNYAIAYKNRAILYSYSLKDPDRAIDDLGHVIRLKPNDADGYYARGNLYVVRHQPILAILDLDQAIRLEPNHHLAWLNRGAAHLDRLALAAAIRDLDEAIRLKPDFEEAYLFRGFVWFKRSDHDSIGDEIDARWTLRAREQRTADVERAMADFDHAIRLNPDFWQAYSSRGVGHLALDHYDQAIDDLTAALQRRADNTTAYLARGTAWLAKRRPDRALDDYAEVVRRVPAAPEGHVGRALAHGQRAEWALAVADLAEAERLAPKRERALALAFARRCAGQPADAKCQAEEVCFARPWFCARGPVRDMDIGPSK